MTLYYQLLPAKDEMLKAAIREVVGQFPICGYRRVTAEMQRRDWKPNHNCVVCLISDLGLHAKYLHFPC